MKATRGRQRLIVDLRRQRGRDRIDLANKTVPIVTVKFAVQFTIELSIVDLELCHEKFDHYALPLPANSGVQLLGHATANAVL